MRAMSGEKPVLKFKVLEPDAVVPKYATDGSAGFDFTCLNEVEIPPGRSELIRTGLAVGIPEGYFISIVPRSSTGLKTPLRMPHSMGVIDSDYRGEIMLLFQNTGRKPFIVQKGRKLAQGIVMPFVRMEMATVSYMWETVRGEGGFGSTDVKRKERNN